MLFLTSAATTNILSMQHNAHNCLQSVMIQLSLTPTMYQVHLFMVSTCEHLNFLFTSLSNCGQIDPDNSDPRAREHALLDWSLGQVVILCAMKDPGTVFWCNKFDAVVAKICHLSSCSKMAANASGNLQFAFDYFLQSYSLCITLGK